MLYATEARIQHGARCARMRALVASLRDYGCVARIEWERRVIVLEVPEDDVAWILTGGFAELLADYADCLQWRPRFHERHRPRAGLPAPAGRGQELSRTS